MLFRYVPILKWKQGERSALDNLDPATKDGVTPHLIIAQAQFTGSKKPKAGQVAKKAPLTADQHLAKQVADAWGTLPFYLDASRLGGTANHHSLDDIRKNATALGLHLIPSATLQAGPSYLAAIDRANAKDHHGACLRISLNEMTDLQNLIGKWQIAPPETDLIIDLGNSVASVLALGTSVHGAFAKLHLAKLWRSVTMAGGSIPATLAGYAVGMTSLPRSELQLWQNLSQSGLSYHLDYGDYATVGPNALTENIEGPVPINAKYSLPSSFAIFHGVKIKGPGSKPRDVQYRSYATAIQKLPGRVSLPNCWGDGVIDQIAKVATASPGSPASWVGYSVNRHIELTRATLP